MDVINSDDGHLNEGVLNGSGLCTKGGDRGGALQASPPSIAASFITASAHPKGGCAVGPIFHKIAVE
jgi:hypothetical protein